jgi:hypothetical protein
VATTFGREDDFAEYDAMIAAVEQAGRLLSEPAPRAIEAL